MAYMLTFRELDAAKLAFDGLHNYYRANQNRLPDDWLSHIGHNKRIVKVPDDVVLGQLEIIVDNMRLRSGRKAKYSTAKC